MKSSEISLVPLSADKFDALRNRKDVQQCAGKVPQLGTNFDHMQQTTVFAGHCDRFDLSTPEGRSQYAELSAKLLPGMELQRLWEERVHGPDGSIYVYVSYVRIMNVYREGNEIL